MYRACFAAIAITGLAVAVTCGYAAEPPAARRQPVHGVRVAAEWEPVTGVLIGWPLRLPKELVREMAKDVDLYVIVRRKAGEERARAAFAGWGIDPKRLHFIITERADGYYIPRDWGPFAVFDPRGEYRLVDGRFVDYPLAGIDSSKGRLSLARLLGADFSADDVAPGAVAKALGAARTELPIALTGGNVFFDGLGTAFTTQIMIDENAGMGIPKDRFLRTLREELGVERCHVVPNFEGGLGVQHIDCLLKLLDEERILIKCPPKDHPNAKHIEAAVEYLAQLTSPYGRPYTLLRIETPAYDKQKLANYTNALILNRKIFVPLFGIPADDQALATWRAAMPGYAVFGFALDREETDLRYTDAFHCRTRGVWDQKMLYMTHRRAQAQVHSAPGYKVEAHVRDYSGAGLVEDQLRLAWRVAGGERWTEIRLKPAGAEHTYFAMIEGLPPGQTVEYFLSAACRAGRRESLPRTAPEGLYSFKVEEKR